eukprot:scaffold7746_cov350-Prasinococcus_capsulatus_cf.AAC.1
MCGRGARRTRALRPPPPRRMREGMSALRGLGTLRSALGGSAGAASSSSRRRARSPAEHATKAAEGSPPSRRIAAPADDARADAEGDAPAPSRRGRGSGAAGRRIRLENFLQVLRTVRERDDRLLSESDRQVFAAFADVLEYREQQLILTMYLRKGPWFRLRELTLARNAEKDEYRPPGADDAAAERSPRVHDPDDDDDDPEQTSIAPPETEDDAPREGDADPLQANADPLQASAELLQVARKLSEGGLLMLVAGDADSGGGHPFAPHVRELEPDDMMALLRVLRAAELRDVCNRSGVRCAAAHLQQGAARRRHANQGALLSPPPPPSQCTRAELLAACDDALRV